MRHCSAFSAKRPTHFASRTKFIAATFASPETFMPNATSRSTSLGHFAASEVGDIRDFNNGPSRPSDCSSVG
jgi:hypothetical protein